MPVPVSEIPVTFSMPGFLLLGRQDMRELLSPETLTLCLISVLAVSADATGSQSCNPVTSHSRWCCSWWVPLREPCPAAELMVGVCVVFSIFTLYSI